MKVGQVVKVVKLNYVLRVDSDHPLYERIGIIVDEHVNYDQTWLQVLVGLDKKWFKPDWLEVIE